MTHNDLAHAIRGLDPRLREELGVAALYVFGSVARGEAGTRSDVDLLVEFEGPPTSARFMDLKFLLEDTLGARVDLVTRRALRERLRPRIESVDRVIPSLSPKGVDRGPKSRGYRARSDPGSRIPAL